MVAPINKPKLNIATDLEVESSCNCFCCPSFSKTPTLTKTPVSGEKTPLPPDDALAKTPVVAEAKKYWDEKHPSWGRMFSKKSVNPEANSPKIDEKDSDMTRAAEKTSRDSARFFTFKNFD